MKPATSSPNCTLAKRKRSSALPSSPAACGPSCRPRCTLSDRACGESPLEKREVPTLLLHDESRAAVEEREKAFLLGTYARTPFHPRSGKGARIVDANGRAYWDLLGGIAVNVLGHRHPRLVKALRDESNALLHISNLYYHPAQGLLGEKLVRESGLLRAFFCNSGSEANEAALKFARLANRGKSGLVALK